MSSFHERQKNLFNQLKSAEDQYSFCKDNKASVPESYGTIDKHVYRKLKHEMKQFRGKESIFKRSDANIRECLRARTIPDYIKNPKKWVYYSLADVTPEQMSEKTNTETALALLRKLEDQNVEINYEEDIDETGAIFKKPTFKISKTIKEEPKEEQQAVFKSNKVIMPEYVVGVSKKKVKKQTVIKKEPQNRNNDIKVELKLNHLYEDDLDT